jgi:signal transduction histidine kinase
MELEGLFLLPVQTIIYRIFQEGLTNIGKHAQAKAVTISSKKEQNRVRFVIHDDGAGFNVNDLGSGDTRDSPFR